MRADALLLLCLLALIPVQALDYERKPGIEILSISYVDIQKGITTPISSNYVGKGDKILIITVYNPAVREEVKYASQMEAGFFNSREDMLFTAYNVEFELIGNDALKIKSGKIKLPALPPMTQQVSLQFYVEVGDSKEVELKLRVSYERIDGLTLIPFSLYPVITGRTDTISNSSSGITITNTTTYKYDILLNQYELDYVLETKEIPIKLYVEEKDVLLEVKDLKAENLVAGGKGTIDVTIKNLGKKTAKNAYAIIELPKSQQSATQSTALPESMLPFMMSSGMSTSTSSSTTSQPTYFIGDLKPGETAKASFYVSLEVSKGGVYPVKLRLVYLDDYGNLKESDPVSFGITVLSKPEISVKEIESRLYVNSKGDLIVEMTSNLDLSSASARISVSSPLSALSSECYIGDVKAGEKFKAFFKLRASSEAKATKYPAELYIKFKAGDDFVETDAIKIGVEVLPEIEFEVIGTPQIRAGEEKIVTFSIRNTGSAEIRDATARLVIVSPFTSSDDTAYIGNLKPGEVANASFKLSVDRDATPKLYALNLEVKYKAENGDWVISAPAKAVIDVKPYEVSYILYLVVAILIVLGAIYYLRRRR